MHRSARFLLLWALWCWAGVVWGQSNARDNPQLFVGVYNDAAIPKATLLAAEDKTSTIYRRAGVELHWLNSPALRYELAVRIISKSRNLANDIFGVAFLDSTGFGRQADIFYGNITELSAAWSQNEVELLGCVMAHEIGHLLLGSNSHSPTGIMRLHWDDQQLHLASLGQLAFDREEIRKIHQRLPMHEGILATNQACGPGSRPFCGR